MTAMLPTVLAPPLGRVLDVLCCPVCRSELHEGDGVLACAACAATYPVVDGIFDLRPPASREKQELEAWSAHWSDGQQLSLAQRFFSFYRKAVFARAVRYFVGRYFPADGMFVEAGSGTAETSMRIDKLAGRRTLIAVDIVLPVLARCHPIMDVRVCGDIFQLPLSDESIDGAWNVGVVEHFTHDQIDAILRELHRVLKPDGRIILLWPGTDSVPQKLLRLVETIVNFRRRGGGRFQFHPDEISQLRSLREGKQVLARNGFQTLATDYGWRSLLAFKTLVGAKGVATV